MKTRTSGKIGQYFIILKIIIANEEKRKGNPFRFSASDLRFINGDLFLAEIKSEI
jgi:hypothetical protein